MEQNNLSVGGAKVRTVRSEEQVLTILEEFEKSGFTAKEYCAISELNETTFYSWLRKYRQRSEEEIITRESVQKPFPSFLKLRWRQFA
jgi:hypothetical protein